MASIKFANKYSTAGLDVDGIEKLKEAIKTYIKAIEETSDNLDTTKNTDWDSLVKLAIKGSGSEQSAKSYITSICNECKDNIKLYDSFVKALDQLEDNYRKKDSSGYSLSLESSSVSVDNN